MHTKKYKPTRVNRLADCDFHHNLTLYETQNNPTTTSRFRRHPSRWKKIGSEDWVPGLNLGKQCIHRRRRNPLKGRWQPRGLVVLVNQASAHAFVEIADRHHVLYRRY